MKISVAIVGVGLFFAVGWAGAAEVRRDVEYGRVEGEALLLDVGVPEGEGLHPVAILVHGGGWCAGDKAGSDHPGDGADVSPWFGPLTDAGFTWFSINYRLAPAHRWPACFDDVRTAIRWVKAHAREFGGDPERIALIGHSAGGHLVCLAAVEADASTRVQAVVGCAPVTDFEYELPRRGGLSASLQALLDRPKEVTPEALAILREIAPITHVRAGVAVPPMLLMQGEADRTVPAEETKNFATAVKAAGGRVDLVILPGAQHRLLEWKKHDPEWTGKMVAWLETMLGKGEN